jgi:PAS domain S-box-containing protein
MSKTKIPLVSLERLLGSRSEENLKNKNLDSWDPEQQQQLQIAALNAAANAIIITDRSGKILWCNDAFVDLTGYSLEEIEGENPRILKSDLHTREFYQEMWNTVLAGRVWQGELVNRKKDGSHYSERMTISPLQNPQGKVIHFIAIKEDITVFKKNQQALERRLAEVTTMSKVALAGIQETDEDQLIARVTELVGDAIYSDHFGILLLTADGMNLTTHPSYQGIPDELKSYLGPLDIGVVGRCAREKATIRVSDVRSDGDYREATPQTRSELAVPLIAEGNLIGVINAESKEPNNFQDYDVRLLETIASQLGTAISKLRANKQEREQRRIAEALAEIAMALNSSLNIEEIIEQVLEKLAGLIPYKTASVFLQKNGAARVFRHRGYSELGLESWLENMEIDVPASDFLILKRLYSKKQPILIPDTEQNPEWTPLSKTSWIRSYLGVPILQKGSLLGFINLNHELPQAFDESDIKIMIALANQVSTALENADLYRQQKKQLNFLESLRRIDHAITGNMDLTVTLNVIMTEITERLDMDAVNILVYDASAFQINTVGRHGFRQQHLHHLDITHPEGLIGEIIRQRNPIVIPDLESVELTCERLEHFLKEEFRAYYGIPLMAKGKVVGVLELFHRSLIDLTAEWQRYAETVAAQTAIAIDNSQLFSNLQMANMELSMAYDNTLEGWAGALELRDHETEGHSRRVVDLTMALVEAMGIPKDQRIHIRRGALLHDIGKMGVPDRILQKEGKLDEREWEIMKKHPLYARQWLKPIAYLKPALDIPIYHHERWDGAGYPEGLAGENIPLAARIFAVIDVWDALRSDRPYRDAWPVEKVKRYIREESGKHFDPAVVDAFLGIVVADD